MPDTSNTRSMTVREALNLLAHLPALDGHVESTTVETKAGEKTTTTKTIPYVFGPEGKGGGKVRWNIAKANTILAAEQATFAKARDALINEISNGVGSIQPDDVEGIAKLTKDTAALLDSPIEIRGLLNLSLADLNLDGNPDLSPSVLAALSTIISE